MSNQEQTREQLIAQINALKAEQAALMAQAKTMPRELTIKVSEKGAVSVYGLGRFPVTLYGSQWERLIESSPKIAEFLAANQAHLKTKG